MSASVSCSQRKLVWTVSALLAAFLGAAYLSDTARRATERTVTFKKEFGRVRSDSQVVWRFEIRNPYGFEVNIREVKTSCSCAGFHLDHSRWSANGDLTGQLSMKTSFGKRRAKVFLTFEEDVLPTVLEVSAVASEGFQYTIEPSVVLVKDADDLAKRELIVREFCPPDYDCVGDPSFVLEPPDLRMEKVRVIDQRLADDGRLVRRYGVVITSQQQELPETIHVRFKRPTSTVSQVIRVASRESWRAN